MKKLKILIVEDEVLVAFQLEMALTRAGYAVCAPVESGLDAIESAKNENPDLVLMDIALIGTMDGIEAARRIGEFSAARIIFTTGYQDMDLKEQAMLLNPLAYLIKPVRVDDIERVIHSVKWAMGTDAD